MLRFVNIQPSTLNLLYLLFTGLVWAGARCLVEIRRRDEKIDTHTDWIQANVKSSRVKVCNGKTFIYM